MLPDPIRQRAEEIAHDTTRGALPLAFRVLEAYEELGEKSSREAVAELHRTMVSAQPWMVAVRNASLLGRHLIMEGRGDRIGALRDRLLQARQEVAQRAVEAIQGAKALVTISYSSDVFETLSHTDAPDDLRVYVCESRPLQEGIQLALNLRRAGVDAILIADAAGPTLVKKADAVLSGADSLLRGGSLVNKIGTLSLALAAHEYDVRFLPLLEVLKVELEGQEIKWVEERREPTELSREGKAMNFYFEEIEHTLLDTVVTDAGLTSVQGLLERFRGLKDLEQFYLT